MTKQKAVKATRRIDWRRSFSDNEISDGHSCIDCDGIQSRKFYRKITALRDDARRNREKWRFL